MSIRRKPGIVPEWDGDFGPRERDYPPPSIRWNHNPPIGDGALPSEVEFAQQKARKTARESAMAALSDPWYQWSVLRANGMKELPPMRKPPSGKKG